MHWNYINTRLPGSLDAERPATISCIVKTDHKEIFRLNYDTEYKQWQYSESNIPYSNDDYGTIECWVLCNTLDRDLTNQSSYWAYNFNDAFLENAIPALSLWIDKGMSYPSDVGADAWKAHLTKLRDIFVEYQTFNNSKYDLVKEERKAKWNEINTKIKEAFNFIGEHFDDMWD